VKGAGDEGPQGAAAGGEILQDPADEHVCLRSKSGSDSKPMMEEKRAVKGTAGKPSSAGRARGVRRGDAEVQEGGLPGVKGARTTKYLNFA
jgi:hypothetical protein